MYYVICIAKTIRQGICKFIIISLCINMNMCSILDCFVHFYFPLNAHFILPSINPSHRTICGWDFFNNKSNHIHLIYHIYYWRNDILKVLVSLFSAADFIFNNFSIFSWANFSSQRDTNLIYRSVYLDFSSSVPLNTISIIIFSTNFVFLSILRIQYVPATQSIWVKSNSKYHSKGVLGVSRTLCKKV